MTSRSILAIIQRAGLTAAIALFVPAILHAEPNLAPELAAIADQNVNEGALLQVTAVATDPDSPNGLSYSLDAGSPAGSEIDPATGVFSWTPAEDQGPADYSVTVRVTDDGVPVLDASRTFTIHVGEVNDTPVLQVIADQTVTEGAELQLTASATDDDIPANSLTYSLDAGAPDGATIDATTGVFRWTPTEAQGPADYSVTVRVTDDGAPALDVSRTFVIHVGEVNDAPVMAAIADQTIDEGQLLSFVVTATDHDLPANALTFWLDIGSPAGAAINPVTGTFTWTPFEELGPWTYSIPIHVTDNGTPARTDTRIVVIQVREANRVPVLSAIGNKSVNEGAPLTFAASATDPDVPVNALSFSLDAGAPAGAAINATTGVFTWTPSEAQGPADYGVTVRVTDNGTPAMAATRTFSIHVNEVNIAPQLAPVGNKIASEGSPLTFTASAWDADIPSNTLTYSLESGAPAGAAINASTGAFTWTPGETQGGGDYSVTIRVSDSGTPSLSSSAAFLIHVNETNSAPAIAAIFNQTVYEEATLTLTASAGDPDVPANSLTYSLDSGAPLGATINSASGVFSWTPSESQGPGVYAITVRATDNGVPSASASTTFLVQVDESNNPPALVAPAWITAVEGDPVSFQATGSDIDLPANTLTFGLVPPSPAGATIDAATGVVSWTTQVHGVETLRVSLSDGQGATVTRDVVVTVYNVTPVVVMQGPAAQAVYAINTPITFTASFADGPGDTHQATWSVGGEEYAGSVDETAHRVTLTRSFSAAGMYPVSVEIVDAAGAASAAHTVGSEDAMILVYDPSIGNVTGAGSIQTLGWETAFDFTAYYERGEAHPLGRTRVQCPGMDFQSTGYDWMMITGPQALYQGSGTINGSGAYAFQLWVADASPDRIRIKIWEVASGSVVFDNQPGASVTATPAQEIDGGWIRIETTGGGGGRSIAPANATPVAGMLEYALSPNWPNPFARSTRVFFALPEPSRVRLAIHDTQGRVVAELENGTLQAGRHERAWDGRLRTGRTAEPGVYFLRLEARSETSARRFETVRKIALTK